ncbi:branched-chain amino acid ABC transporter permease [Pelagibius litoralis]|uniref:Branched-chain amino acid ABC transporter permease n=1 Tax=Pelagibius litoralis TaxID=374515 RepID=A0A967C3R2_9PROT|nr:branched-chain amino acid ABC transporter permease [Pelagibius litoralis]NIA67740.1 branched-chain amino acid ABC transporter permease [Pelagibius litoralis]
MRLPDRILADRRIRIDGLVWGAFLALPLVLGEWEVTQIAQYLTYGIFAMSLALIWGQCGLMSFGHAVFFGLGAYAMSLSTLGLLPGMEGWTSSYLGIALALVLPAAFANLLGRFLFFGRGLQGAQLAIVMLAVAVIAERLMSRWSYAGGMNGLMSVPPLNLGILGAEVEIFDPLPLYYLTLVAAILVYAGLEVLVRSRRGVLLRAVGDDETRTAFLGHNTRAVKLWVFTLSAAVAGFAGALFVTQFGFVSPPLIGFGLSTEVLIWVALGGRHGLLTAFLGAIVVRLAESFLADLFGDGWLLGLGLLFVLCVIFLPRGLLGEAYWHLVRPRSLSNPAQESKQR